MSILLCSFGGLDNLRYYLINLQISDQFICMFDQNWTYIRSMNATEEVNEKFTPPWIPKYQYASTKESNEKFTHSWTSKYLLIYAFYFTKKQSHFSPRKESCSLTVSYPLFEKKIRTVPTMNSKGRPRLPGITSYIN